MIKPIPNFPEYVISDTGCVWSDKSKNMETCIMKSKGECIMPGIDERIKQCDVGIEALEEQKRRLLEEKHKEEAFQPGDVVVNEVVARGLIVNIYGVLYAVGKDGCCQATPADSGWKRYIKIGTCAGFTVF